MQTLQDGPAKNGTSEKVKEKMKPSVWAAPSSRRATWAARELGVCPGGDRVTAWQRLGWPRGALAPGLTR